MIGCACSYRREVFSKFKFEEKFTGFSPGDDVDLSYRVYKRFPGKLYQTPYAKLIHKRTPIGRAPAKRLILVGEIYHFFLVHKLGMGTIGYITFLWSRLGKLILELGKLILKPSSYQMLTIFYLIQAYFCVFTHRNSIKKGKWKFLLSLEQ